MSHPPDVPIPETGPHCNCGVGGIEPLVAHADTCNFKRYYAPRTGSGMGYSSKIVQSHDYLSTGTGNDLSVWCREMLLHDGGPASQDYDASKFTEARERVAVILGRIVLSSGSAQEMDLAQWIGQLPPYHRVQQQFQELYRTFLDIRELATKHSTSPHCFGIATSKAFATIVEWCTGAMKTFRV